MNAQTPRDMAAIAIRDGALIPTRRPVPQPGPGEVLIKIAAAGVNRPDVMQRKGLYPPPPGASDLPGLEVAGVIVAVGDGIEADHVGERVCALLPGGGYAEFAAAHADLTLPIPDGLDLIGAAAVVETGFTVWDNLFTRGRLTAGERALIHGGSSGIGAMAIQLAKAHGAQVAITAGSDGKCAFCAGLGADLTINYHKADFAEAIAAWSGREGVNVVLDMVGAAYMRKNLDCLAVDGRHVSIATMKGKSGEIDIFEMMVKRWTLTGSTLRGRSVAEKAAVADRVEAEVWPLLASGEVRPMVGATFALADAADAHVRMESGDNMGKIVLAIDL